MVVQRLAPSGTRSVLRTGTLIRQAASQCRSRSALIASASGAASAWSASVGITPGTVGPRRMSTARRTVLAARRDRRSRQRPSPPAAELVAAVDASTKVDRGVGVRDRWQGSQPGDELGQRGALRVGVTSVTVPARMPSTGSIRAGWSVHAPPGTVLTSSSRQPPCEGDSARRRRAAVSGGHRGAASRRLPDNVEGRWPVPFRVPLQPAGAKEERPTRRRGCAARGLRCGPAKSLPNRECGNEGALVGRPGHGPWTWVMPRWAGRRRAGWG